jgi:UTP-glucose-1-phosphate uridylyltransferase
LKIEIEVEEAVYKFLEQIAINFGLTVEEYVASNVNATVLFTISHREEIKEHNDTAPELAGELEKFVEHKRNKIKEGKK